MTHDQPAPDQPTAARPALWRLLVVGVVGGLLSGAFGIGGGIVMVPLLTVLARLDPKRASAASLAAIVPTSIVASITYLVQGEVDLLAAAIVAGGSIVGTIVGGHLLRVVATRVLQWLFVGVIVVAAVRLLLAGDARAASTGLVPDGPWSIVALVALGLVMGVASGLFGIGGGLIAVPGLVGLLGETDLVAKGTSLVVMIPTAAIGTWGNARRGFVAVVPALLLGVAAAVSSFGGVALAFAMPARLSAVLFAALLLVVAVQQAVRAVRGR